MRCSQRGLFSKDTTLKFILSFFLFINTPVNGLAEGLSVPEDIRATIDKINKWESFNGTWEGHYGIRSMSDELLEKGEDGGLDGNHVGIRIVVTEASAKLYLKYSQTSEWKEIQGKIQLVPDNMDWHIYVMRDSGVWLERYWITVNRVREFSGFLAITRTVHNWHNPSPEDTPSSFAVFGEGSLSKVR